MRARGAGARAVRIHVVHVDEQALRVRAAEGARALPRLARRRHHHQAAAELELGVHDAAGAVLDPEARAKPKAFSSHSIAAAASS